MDDLQELEALAKMRGDGQPYSEEFDKAYAEKTPEEQAETDAFMEQLRTILGDDDD